ncbi:MAG: hypothetical protein ACK40M_04860 [Flavobacteriales bacterium]
MLRLLFLLILLIPATCYAQSDSATLHTHRWAGGICCRHGSNYTLTFSDFREKGIGIDSIVVCNGMRSFTVKGSAITRSGNLFVITFSEVYDQTNIWEGKSLEETFPACSDQLFVLYRKGKGEKRIFTRHTHSMTAYP